MPASPSVSRRSAAGSAVRGGPRRRRDCPPNLALAVTEALTNAVLHAYIGMEPGEVTVTAQAAPGELLVPSATVAAACSRAPTARGSAWACR